MSDKKYKELFSPVTLCRLERLAEELAKWNKKFSLTKVRDDKMLDRLIAPSAWLGLEYGREDIGLVADFGCGPGIPGLPMAIADGRNRYLLIDSNSKKTRFIDHCIKVVGLVNKDLAQAKSVRVTKKTPIGPVDRLVTRAAGSMLEVIELWQGKVKPGGAADFFKGLDAEREIDELLASRPEAQVERLAVPEWFEDLTVTRVRGVF